MGPKLIGVAIVEDHPLYRQGLIQVVEAVEGLTVVAAVGTLKEIEMIGLEGVEVVLLDLHLPDGIGAGAVSRVKGLGATIIVISASDDRESVVDAIGAGRVAICLNLRLRTRSRLPSAQWPVEAPTYPPCLPLICFELSAKAMPNIR